ncbi:FAD-dependent monooxygenase [Streptomyces sp. NPDC058175]|uniref:FAD-dependent monooxygenase n=1 Tax=Streptomyces sp. NPDC058175 TaxID=3346367 RepID=UPI0036E7B111
MGLAHVRGHGQRKVPRGLRARALQRLRRGATGDAAHIHLPAGGQGMNTGIQVDVI